MGISLKGQTPHQKMKEILLTYQVFLKKSGEQDFFYNLEIRDRLVMSAFPHVKQDICLNFRAFPGTFLFLFFNIHITLFVLKSSSSVWCDKLTSCICAD